jgi:long-chain acyl-CoA synthetase
MYPGLYAQKFADRPAFIMATSGEAVTYGELEARSNRLAHLLRAQGLQRLGHYEVFMENNSRYVEACVAGERSGLYYTCINGYLQADELAYILNNSASKVLITSQAKRDVALAALAHCPGIALCIVVGIALGQWFPPVFQTLGAAEVVGAIANGGIRRIRGEGRHVRSVIRVDQRGRGRGFRVGATPTPG